MILFFLHSSRHDSLPEILTMPEEDSNYSSYVWCGYADGSILVFDSSSQKDCTVLRSVHQDRVCAFLDLHTLRAPTTSSPHSNNSNTPPSSPNLFSSSTLNPCGPWTIFTVDSQGLCAAWNRLTFANGCQLKLEFVSRDKDRTSGGSSASSSPSLSSANRSSSYHALPTGTDVLVRFFSLLHIPTHCLFILLYYLHVRVY